MEYTDMYIESKSKKLTTGEFAFCRLFLDGFSNFLDK